MRILLAVSGGADSMYLAERASEFFPEASFAVAHCNFSLRGEESDADEAFVRDWCIKHSMRLHTVRFDTAAEAAREGISIEMAARKLRYRWFASLCRDEGYDAVAVAHNANDEAETFLLNLLRGCGTRGLRGMSPDSEVEGVRVLRPMLSLSRSQIEEWMRSSGLTWREDSSNSDTSYKRNRLRTRVLPEFRKINPSFLRTLSRDMEHIREVDAIAQDYWEKAVSEGLVSEDGMVLDLGVLARLKHRDYLVMRFLEGRGFSEMTLEALLRTLDGDCPAGKIFESGEWLAETATGRLILSQRHPYGADCIAFATEEKEGRSLLPNPVNETVTVPGPETFRIGDCCVSVRELPVSEIVSLRQPDGSQIFDALPFPFTIRPWRAGDYLFPLGLGGRKKLSDLFNDLGYSLSDKRRALVVVDSDGSSNHIAALLGKRIDESKKVTTESKNSILITITKSV